MLSGNWQPSCLGLNVLIHWGRDKINTISQTTFSNAFYCKTSLKFVPEVRINNIPGAGHATSHNLNKPLSDGWGLLKLRSSISPKQHLRSRKSTCHILGITFILDRCVCNWAAATPVKYERNIQYLTCILAILKKMENNRTEEIVFAAPTPDDVLVTSGNKTLLGPTPTQISTALLRH